MPPFRTSLLAVLVLFGFGSGLAAQPAQDPAIEFASGLERVERFVERREHDRAAKVLDELLSAHEKKDYVRIRRQELIELRRRIDFGREVSMPDPKTLVGGKLSKYSRTTGELTLEYEVDSFGALTAERTDSPADFVDAQGLCVHKIVFAGPYQVDYAVAGDKVGLVILLDDENGYVIEGACIPVMQGGLVVDREVGAAISAIVKGKAGEPTTERAKKRTRGDSFDFRVKVSGNSIEVYIDGKRFLRRENDGRFGRIAITTRSDRGKLKVSGKAEPAFLQDKVDAALAGQRKDFEKGWDVRKAVPEWLFDAIEVEAVATVSPTKKSPGNLMDMPEKQTVIFFGALENDQLAKARSTIEMLEKFGLDAPAKAWLEVQLKLAFGPASEARSRLDALLALEPRFLEGFTLRAELLLNDGDRNGAREAAAALARDFPNDAEAFESAIPLLMVLGRAADGKVVVDDAIARGISSPKLVSLNRMLVKALRGPDFPRRYEHQTEHYHVISDIDSRTCRQAALVLEQGFRSYEKLLFALEGQKNEPFEVFLFSGQSSYLEYSKGTLGQSVVGSAGLYSQFLKQLLIWNVPTRESMEETIRHEGFHQYLDRVLPNAPIWLNEGLAVYNETGKLEFGKWKTGEVRRDYLRLFEVTSLTPLEKFLAYGPRQFQNPQSIHLNYGQAWLMVHFLTHGPEPRRQLMTDFLAALRAGKSAAAATSSVFGKIDLDELEKELRAYARLIGN